MTQTSVYAIRARQHWEQFLPNRFRKLTDPQTFFEDLGNQIGQKVADRQDALMRGHEQGSSFLDNYAALNTARIQAEEEVLAEMLPPPEEDDPPS